MHTKKIVVIGGGSGSFAVLSGLKNIEGIEITSVVSMFDSGGSSGILRDEHGVLPPGDVRRCLVALSEEGLLRDLFQYRFPNQGSVNGHSLGNLLLAALKDITGSDVEGIKAAAKLFPIKGCVLPVTSHSAKLCARLANGVIVEGETNIDIPKHDGSIPIEKVFLTPEVDIWCETRDAIVNADIVVFSPGDLYTSLIPNLLVSGMKEAIKESNARFVYVCNLMTKWGETNGFTASRFIQEVVKYSGLEMLDTVICNGVPVSDHLLLKYKEEKALPVIIDAEASKYTHTLVVTDIIHQSDIVRHDSSKLAHVLLNQ